MPPGASRTRVVSGSVIGMMPVSNRTVATQIQFDPDIGGVSSGSMMMKPIWAFGFFGMKVVFPGVQRGSKPVVSLGCMVVGVRDSVRLHYDLDIEDIDDEACLQLAEFRSLRGFEKVG